MSDKELEKVPIDLDLELIDRLDERLIIDDGELSKYMESKYSKDTSITDPFFLPVPEELLSLQATESASPSALIEE